MALSIESFLPATLSAHPMSDERFASFCAEHPDLSFEMTAEGDIIIMTSAYSRIIAIGAQLQTWTWKDGRGITCDSSASFVLPNGARRSPDARWIVKSAQAVQARHQRARNSPIPPCRNVSVVRGFL